MAALPQNSTPRVFFDYVTGSGTNAQQHTCAIRYNNAVATDTEVQQGFFSLLSSLGAAAGFRLGWRVVAVRLQAANSDFSVPTPLIANLSSFAGSSSASSFLTNRAESTQYRFDGRDFTTGRRVNLSLYGLALTPPDTFRLTRSTPVVAAALDTLAAMALNGQLVTISNQPPSWYQYLNVQQNSYWESELRV